MQDQFENTYFGRIIYKFYTKVFKRFSPTSIHITKAITIIIIYERRIYIMIACTFFGTLLKSQLC